jgi:hypothetical protein
MNNIKIEPCCGGCNKPYAQAKAIHPSEQNLELWFCRQCVAVPKRKPGRPVTEAVNSA